MTRLKRESTIFKQANKLTSLAFISAILAIIEVLEVPDLKQVVFDVLHHSGGPILDQVVHGRKSLEDAAPLFGLALEFAPQVLHDHIVVFPVEGVVGQHLQFAVGYVPVLIGGGLLEDLLVLCRRKETFLLPTTFIQIHY